MHTHRSHKTVLTVVAATVAALIVAGGAFALSRGTDEPRGNPTKPLPTATTDTGETAMLLDLIPFEEGCEPTSVKRFYGGRPEGLVDAISCVTEVDGQIATYFQFGTTEQTDAAFDQIVATGRFDAVGDEFTEPITCPGDADAGEGTWSVEGDRQGRFICLGTDAGGESVRSVVLTAATGHVLMVLDDLTGDLHAVYDQWSAATPVVE